MRITIGFIITFLCTAGMLNAQPGQDPIKLTDMLKIKSMGDCSVSPDGKEIVFTLRSIEPDGNSKTDYKYTSAIYIVPADGSAAPKQLTVKENASQPVWSPDGRQIAFVRAADGKAQIFLLPLDGGEPIQCTHFRYGASNPKWSPDGKSILFSASLPLKDLIKDSLLNPGHQLPAWPYEQPGDPSNNLLKPSTAKPDPDGNLEEVRAWLNNNVTDKKAKLVTRLNFQDEMEVSNDLSFNQFFIQPLGDAHPEPVALIHGFYRFNAADFTPDGKQVILAGSMDSARHPDRVLESGIFTVASNGTGIKAILGSKGSVYSNALLSPAGTTLAYLVNDTSFTRTATLVLSPYSTGTQSLSGQELRIPFDRSKSSLQWSADGKYLYFTAPSNGGVPVYRVDIAARKVQQLTDYNTGIGSYDLHGNQLTYVATNVADPFELYTADADGQHARRISAFNYDWVKTKQIVQPEKHSFVNEKGLTIEYWIMKPANYSAGKKYPLLLDIHGGPTAMWGPGESSMWHEFQYFAAKGYGIVYCNPRGSGGYGEAFTRANIEDWGRGPASDVLTALNKAVAEGWADTAQLVVSGGSYAGYLTAWIVGHDHRFKAACAQRGVYDLATFFGEGNAWRLVPNYFGGYPWQPATKAILQRESPITYVDKITTPLIIFHGENDRRTGFVQGEMLFRSLKALGRPVEYVRHPGATHEITRAGDNRQRMDQMLRTWEFFERCLQHTDK